MNELVTTLYRPVRQAEYDLIKGSRFHEFPPRLPEQPIFNPVLSEYYAKQIARVEYEDERSGFVGFVLRFNVKASFLREYDVRIVGSSDHKQYWIPAADLARLNANIVGEIEVIAEFRGKTGKT